jgi:hypothetical protein
MMCGGKANPLRVLYKVSTRQGMELAGWIVYSEGVWRALQIWWGDPHRVGARVSKTLAMHCHTHLRLYGEHAMPPSMEDYLALSAQVSAGGTTQAMLLAKEGVYKYWFHPDLPADVHKPGRARSNWLNQLAQVRHWLHMVHGSATRGMSVREYRDHLHSLHLEFEMQPY